LPPQLGREATALAAKRHEAFEFAAGAVEATEAMREHAAVQEGLQFLFDELRKANAVLSLRGVVQEGGEVLLQNAV
jgi:hypothetical protein